MSEGRETQELTAHTLQLTRGQDLKAELQTYVNKNGIGAGTVLSNVGTLT